MSVSEQRLWLLVNDCRAMALAASESGLQSDEKTEKKPRNGAGRFSKPCQLSCNVAQNRPTGQISGSL
ncbi:MAG TPA: hypothetical protein DCW59_05230 [Alteromonas sp.]|nr:hypothetical protein [Alteromonas sp.]